MDKLYNLLTQRSIIDILIGDKSYGEIEGIEVSMPYLSGPDICSISTLFGFPKNYSWGGGNASRWSYMDDLLSDAIKSDKFQQVFSYLFDKPQFEKKFKNNRGENLTSLSHSQINDIIVQIITRIIKEINNQLYFGGNELQLIAGKFIVKSINSVVKIDAPKIKLIDRAYINDSSERAAKDIFEKNYDSAITKCRTLLEEVFCYVIELKNIQPSDKGDINALYKQVKDLYNMHADKTMDTRINTLLSGLEKIISAIAEMRNKNSDSHGVGNKRLNIDEHHARLFHNSSIAMSDFILAIGENYKIQVSKAVNKP